MNMCGTARKERDDACPCAFIGCEMLDKADVMEGLVMELLKAHMAVYVDARERMRVLNRKAEAAGKRAALEKELSGKEGRREKIGGFIRALYADFADGVFSEGEYLKVKAGYVSELEALDAEMEGLKAEMEGLAPDYGGDGEMAAAFGKYLGAEELTKEMAQTFMSYEEIYLVVVQGNVVGTGSIRKNEICRLFILPEY